MAVSNSLTKANQKMGLTAYLTNDAVKNQINSIIGGANGTRFITSIVSAVNANPALQQCSNQSILSAALLGESLKLSPSPQMAFYYLVPYNSKDGTIAQFQMGYKGFIQLAIRSGQYKKLNVLPIKEGELVKFDPLNEEIEVNLIQDEAEREKAETAGFYAMFEYLNGFKKAIYWSKERMMAHADRYSKAFNAETYKKIQAGKIPSNEMWKYSSPWYSDFNGMACKTMIRQLISKWGVMSTDFEKAYEADQGVIGENGSITYVDNDDSVVEPTPTPTTEPFPMNPPVVEAEAVEPPKEKKKAEPKETHTQEDIDQIAKNLFK